MYSGSMSGHVTLEREESLAILTLNRPDRRNALSLELMLDLIGHLDAIASTREADLMCSAMAS